MSPKSIHVISKYFYPVPAGIETNIMETYSRLVTLGYDVTIHTSNNEYLKKNSLPERETIRGLKVIRYPFSSEVFGFWAHLDWNTPSLICLHNFNVFYWRYLVHSAWLKLIGRKKFSLMVTPHGGFNPEWSMYSPLVKLFKMPYHYTLGTFFMNTVVDSVRAVSGWEKNELIRRGVQENKIVTISNGIEDEAYHDVDSLASLKSKRLVKSLGTYILQIGRIYPIKNYETTIRSLVHTPKNINYCIVGADEKDLGYRNSLLTLAKSLGVSERVKFVGVIKGIDKYYIIKHATMMVHMAIWESFCNVVHEGLSQGLVCIVANNTALPLLVKDGVNGYCVDTYDHLQLSKKINYVLDNYHDPSIIEMRKHIVP